jgi:DNA modification methylase
MDVEDLVKRYHPRNPKAHDLEELRASFDRFGYVESIVICERTDLLASGHGRTELLAHDRIAGRVAPDGIVVDRETGRWQAPVTRGWSSADDDELLAYVIAANRLPERAGWKPELVPALVELQSMDKLEGIGFPPLDVLALLPPEVTPEPVRDPNDTPPEPTVAITQRGDVWVLGRHRVKCGDCRNADEVEHLGATDAQLLLTDPPYCSGGFQDAGRAVGSVGSRQGTVKKIENDQLSTRGYIALMRSAIAATQVRAAYIFTDWRMWVTLFDVVESNGYGVRAMIVWDKGTMGMGRGWRSQHELIMFGSKDSLGGTFDNHDALGNVIHASRTGNQLHTTQKPVEVITKLLHVSSGSTTVYDPFGGSGTTLVACEQMGRQCWVMEKDPGYVDVIVHRWVELTGQTAVRESDGREWQPASA